MKNTIFVGTKNETICGLKLMLTQRTQKCEYIDEWINIKTFKTNNSSEYLAYLNQSRFPFQIFYISLPQDQTRSIYFFMSQEYTSYVYIVLKMCLRTTWRSYNAGGCTSGTDIVLNLMTFVSISYIFGFRNDRQMI